MAFSDEIIGWYEEHGRSLPWRGIDNPYFIWLSEIILQQTRIEQGRDYYERFVTAYPTVRDLAAADEQQVLKLWQGLGYYSRARNLHAAARYIVDELDGRFPDTYEGILALKGVGRYTAAAIVSFAFKLPYPVIDGNVYRLVSRCFGLTMPIGTTAAYNEFESLLLRLIDRQRPDVFNQAMMDFGSLYCRPLAISSQGVMEACSQCVLAHRCVAYQEGRVGLLPVKKAAVQVKVRYFYYLDIRWVDAESEYMLVHCRTGDDVWKGLYEVPLWEVPQPLPEAQADKLLRQKVKELCGGQVETLRVWAPMTHKLTHRDIVATYVAVKLGTPPTSVPSECKAIPLAELANLPVSRLMECLLAKR